MRRVTLLLLWIAASEPGARRFEEAVESALVDARGGGEPDGERGGVRAWEPGGGGFDVPAERSGAPSIEGGSAVFGERDGLCSHGDDGAVIGDAGGGRGLLDDNEVAHDASLGGMKCVTSRGADVGPGWGGNGVGMKIATSTGVDVGPGFGVNGEVDRVVAAVVDKTHAVNPRGLTNPDRFRTP